MTAWAVSGPNRDSDKGHVHPDLKMQVTEAETSCKLRKVALVNHHVPASSFHLYNGDSNNDLLHRVVVVGQGWRTHSPPDVGGLYFFHHIWPLAMLAEDERGLESSNICMAYAGF